MYVHRKTKPEPEFNEATFPTEGKLLVCEKRRGKNLSLNVQSERVSEVEFTPASLLLSLLIILIIICRQESMRMIV